jgi:uncharacterized protein (TIGR02300 family)
MDRGSKHICPECTTKYYDLKKTPVLCPKCGAKPVLAKVSKSAPQAKKSGRSTYWRYP